MFARTVISRETDTQWHSLSDAHLLLPLLTVLTKASNHQVSHTVSNKMFRKLVFLFSAFVAATASSSNEEGEAPNFPYVFDHDHAGVHCDKALDDIGEEEFRLYCINQVQSFRNCALSCSAVLHFESSIGACKSHRCNFYDFRFPSSSSSNGGSSSILDMKEIAHGKVTMFVTAPLWEGHSQYMYELLENIRSEYADTTEALYLPIDIHDYELTHPRFELNPFENVPQKTQRVHILPEILPREIARHPFFNFVRSLLYRDGAKNFDVYTDRPVVFVINHDGSVVERMVVPTLEQLQTAIEKHGATKGSKLPNVASATKVM